MFDIGLGKMITLGIIALLVFGPDKLPQLAAQAARMLHQVRRFTQEVKADLGTDLGPQFQNVDLQEFRPRSILRKHLLDHAETGFGDRGAVTEPTPMSSPVQHPSIMPGQHSPYDAGAT